MSRGFSSPFPQFQLLPLFQNGNIKALEEPSSGLLSSLEAMMFSTESVFYSLEEKEKLQLLDSLKPVVFKTSVQCKHI